MCDIRVRVAFDLLNVESGTPRGVFSRDASVPHLHSDPFIYGSPIVDKGV
jgi:hypothetical protein